MSDTEIEIDSEEPNSLGLEAPFDARPTPEDPFPAPRESLDLADPADCADVHRRKPLQPRLELCREKMLHLRGGRRLAALVLLRRARLTLERTAVRCATLALDRFAANPLPNRSVRLSAAGRCQLSVVARLCNVSRSNARGEPTGRRYGSRTGVACEPVLNK